MSDLNFKRSGKIIAYIVPDLGISGGIAVILNHVNRLKKLGYRTAVISVDSKVKDVDWFPNEVKIYSLWEANYKLQGQVGIAVATHWSTAHYLEKVNADRKIYFVQSDERRFFPCNEDIKKINETYKIKVEYMTEAIWIQRWLKEEFGHDAYYVPNGIDENIFYCTKPIIAKGKKVRVLLEGPIGVWFKGMNEAYEAVKNLDCEIWIVSSFKKPPLNWRYNAFFNHVPFTEMRKIYSSCDIFLKMSRIEGFFGPPLEAMACGCAVVVGKVTGYDEYIVSRENAIVVQKGNIAEAREAVKNLINNKGLREKLIENGKKTVKKWSWNRSIYFLEKVINKEPVKKMYTHDFPEKYDYIEALKEAKQEFNKFSQDNLFGSEDLDPETLRRVIDEKNQELQFIKSSKFWKIRECYIRIKRQLLVRGL